MADSSGPFLPLGICVGTYYASAFLVQLPQTTLLRGALLPLSLYSSFRAIRTFDAVELLDEPRLNYINYATGVSALLHPKFARFNMV